MKKKDKRDSPFLESWMDLVGGGELLGLAISLGFLIFWAVFWVFWRVRVWTGTAEAIPKPDAAIIVVSSILIMIVGVVAAVVGIIVFDQR